MAEEKEPEQIDAYMGTMELYQKIYDFLLYIYPILAQFRGKVCIADAD